MEFKHIFLMEFNFLFSYLTPLHYAIIENDIETFKCLLNHKNIKIFTCDHLKDNIWHYAAYYGRLEIIKEIASKTTEKVNDYNINHILNLLFSNQTPLMFAVSNKHIDVLNFLNTIDNIDVNIQNNENILFYKF